MRRPNSIFGLTARLIKLRWEKLGRTGRVAVVLATLIGALGLATAGGALLGAAVCPSSGGCPYSSGSSSPCSR